MKHNYSRWLEKELQRWAFHLASLRLSVGLFVLALLVLCLPWSKWYETINAEHLFSIGISLLLISVFNVLYEVQTKDSFYDMLSRVNPNIKSGVTVYPSHDEVIRREEAIATHLKGKGIFRLKTSTADDYVKRDRPPYSALIDKIQHGCTLRILLYLPIFIDGPEVAGQHAEKPCDIIQDQTRLLNAYQEIIDLDPEKVTIKFFFSSFHVNFFMLGNNRMYSSLIPSMGGAGVDKPCFEIIPTSSSSLFFEMQKEFDDVFNSKEPLVSLEFSRVKPLFIDHHGDLAKLKAGVLAIANSTPCS